jgi:ATP-dependent exoDNAse (exonuclease V) beta subunit
MELNRGQVLGLNLDMHVVLDAGAGTGKTACIIQRILEHYLSEDQRATRLLPPGPREVDLGGGFLQSPASQREDLREWRGLLPTEVVVLTFTVKAADEMRDRLRKELSNLRPGPRGARDGLRFDPRIRNEGLVEQLTMLLDEAPIGTIDSFLNRLVSANRNLLADRPTHQQMSDAQRAILRERALSAVWRIQNEGHAGDLRVVSVSTSDFLSARNRLSHQLGGRARAQKVVSKLLTNSLFVDSVRRSLCNLSGEVTADSLRRSFLAHLDEAEIGDFCERLRAICFEWLDAARTCAVELGLTTGLAGQTRVNSLDSLVSAGVPSDVWDRLLWLLHVNLAICTLSNVDSPHPTCFPRGLLPKSDGWDSGINPLGRIRDSDIRAAVKERMEAATDDGRALLGSILGMRMRSCAIIADLLDPRCEPPHSPDSIRPRRLSDPFPAYAEPVDMALTADTDARILGDLLTVQAAVSDVLAELKLQEGLHDHDDVVRLAEELLLARCPRICRRWYPPEVVQALDGIDEQHPWTDSHLDSATAVVASAFSIIKENGVERRELVERFRDWPMTKVEEDLRRRIEVLKGIRRRFRAFIIDEAQDNSDQQWRLLSRLWGVRARQEGDPDVPNSPWQPTVCWVGDQKQSIYGFRQALVSGMSRYTVHLRAINEMEYQNESRLLMAPALRRRDAARDPRLVEVTSFVSGLEYVNHRPIPEEAWKQYDRGDDGRRLDHLDVVRRSEGHVDLVTNYRTCGDLLETMNEWWVDLFDERHHLFPGDWYASAKGLRADRSEAEGRLEWLLPVSTGGARDPTADLTVPLDPFELGSAAKAVHLENEMVAARIRALIDGSPTHVLAAGGGDEVADGDAVGDQSEADAVADGDEVADQSEANASAEVELRRVEPFEAVEPRDIMVLMPSRTHMPDLIRRLDSLGVPALADQEGGLLEQPVVQSLLALLNSVARPTDASRAAALARTPLVGFDDATLEAYLTDETGSSDLIARLSSHAVSEPQRELFSRWRTLADSNRLVRLLDETLDHSDLLLAHPSPVDRQYAEQFLAFVRQQTAEAGGDAVLLSDRLRHLSTVSGRLLEGEAMPPSNAVRVMTIHGSKGLQSKVVIVTGMFSENQSNLGQSLREHTLVTGEILSARIHPWRSRDDIDSGSWRLSKEVLTSQVQAEARRLLYVACTRVKDLLILAGAPENSKLSVGEGRIEVRWQYRPTPRFGWMWLEAMRQAARRDGLLTAPWLLEDDASLAVPLPFRGKGLLSLSPSELLDDAALAPGRLTSLPIHHHPSSLLTERRIRSPLVNFQRLQDSARLEATGVATQGPAPNRVGRMRLAPHLLDSASSCIRRHYLSRYIGLSGEPISLPMLAQSSGDDSGQGVGEGSLGSDSGRPPEANELGSLFHRLVELGLPNPGADESGPSSPLPDQWCEQTSDLMLDAGLLDQVCNELLPVEVDAELTKRMLSRMAERVMGGRFGRLVRGEECDGLTVEGLRTEWPFLIQIEAETGGVADQRWTPHGPHTVQNIEKVVIEFDGVADLVLCQRGEEGVSTIRAIDLKTNGCLKILEPPAELAGTIFEAAAETDVETCRTEAENRLLDNYRMQLFLYHRCLVRQEEMREREGMSARKVLPPAILSAATGRLISWTEEELEQTESDFEALLIKLAKVEASERHDESNFPRLPLESLGVCKSCPYFRGDVRICAPEGMVLGVVSTFTIDAEDASEPASREQA